jgi:hypothetical protein
MDRRIQNRYTYNKKKKKKKNSETDLWWDTFVDPKIDL